MTVGVVSLRLWPRRSARRVDLCRVRELEYELGLMADAERVSFEYERDQSLLRFRSPTDGPGSAVYWSSPGGPQTVANLASTLKDAWRLKGPPGM